MSSVPLGPFEIFETVGSGGMGVVRRAMYRGLGANTPVAVKFVKPPPGDPNRFREAFVREVQSAARLHHPNIVTVYDIGEVSDLAAAEALGVERGTSYLVMEYVDGGTLESQVGELGWEDLREVLLHLLDALAHAHALGIVHRDLKPANVLCKPVEEGFTPMLTDFGIARAMDVEPAEPDDEDEPQRVAGTPYYMAPEHVMGRWRDEGPWTDIYALGALAWHLITGQVPYAGDTGDVLRAHLMADLPSFAPALDLPRGFEQWLRRLLDKDLTRRYRRAADAAWALVQLDHIPRRRVVSRSSALVVADPGPTLSGLTASLDTPRQEQKRPTTVGPRKVRKHGLAPPLLEDWRRGDEGDARTLRGAGLGLFGLRPVPVVGRIEERNALWDGLYQVHATRRPHGVIISGASGTGKSRLVAWLAERSEEMGGAILFKATHNRPMTYADGLVAMMTRFTRTSGLGFEAVLMRVRSLYTDLDLRGEDVLFDAVALTERILGLNPENAAGPRFQSRREWFSALVRLLGALTRERPILLWLDDVHFGTESLEFAHHVLSSHDEHEYPLYVVCTAPAFDGADPVPDKLRALAAMPNVEQVELEPLEEQEMRELVGRMLGLSESLADLVVERTSGSPLFAIQLVEDWVARGALRLDESGFVAPPEVALQLPDDIHATWQDRIDEVIGRNESPEQARCALQVAATLGRDVDPAEWRWACKAFGVAAPEHLVSDLVGAGLATRLESGWSFVHAMLRDSVMRSIGEHVAPYHAACVQALEKVHPERRRPRTSRRLAEHHLASGQPQRAFDELSDSVCAHRDIEEHGALLALANRAVEIQLIHDLQVERVQGATLCWHHAAMLRQSGEVEATMAKIQAGIDALAGEAALQNFVREPDTRINPVLANLLTERAIVLFESEGEIEQSDEILALAQQLATAAATPVALGWASKIRSRMLCTLGRVEEGVAAAQMAVDAYRTVRRERSDYYVSGLGELAGALRASGRLDEALAVVERAENWLEQVGSREALALLAMERAEIARAQERYDDARHHYRISGQLFDMLGSKNSRLVSLNLCFVDLESGDLVSPRSELQKLRDEFPDLGMEALTPHAELGVAACAAAAADWEEYDDAFEAAGRQLRQAGVRDAEVAGLAVICARECAQHEDARRSSEAVELARDLGGVRHPPTRFAEFERLQS